MTPREEELERELLLTRIQRDNAEELARCAYALVPHERRAELVGEFLQPGHAAAPSLSAEDWRDIANGREDEARVAAVAASPSSGPDNASDAIRIGHIIVEHELDKVDDTPWMAALISDIRRGERERTIEEAANLFEGVRAFDWLCIDHGGEEAARIARLIRGLLRASQTKRTDTRKDNAK